MADLIKQSDMLQAYPMGYVSSRPQVYPEVGRRVAFRPTGSKPSWHSPSSVGPPGDKTRRTIGRCGGKATQTAETYFVGWGLHLCRPQPSSKLFNTAHFGTLALAGGPPVGGTVLNSAAGAGEELSPGKVTTLGGAFSLAARCHWRLEVTGVGSIRGPALRGRDQAH